MEAVLITGSGCYECEKTVMPPGVTLPDTAGLAGKVHGEEVNFPTLSIGVENGQEFQWVSSRVEKM